MALLPELALGRAEWPISLNRIVAADGRRPLRDWGRSLSSFIAGFKAYSTKRVNEILKTPEARLWQRNYYEHVIRNDEDLYHTRKYIQENPLKWELDKENPDIVGT